MRYVPRAFSITLLALLFAVVACDNGVADADSDATALTPGDREAIEALFSEYEIHVLAGDWEGYAGLFHPNAIRKYPGTPDFLEGREEILEDAAAMDASIDHLEFQVLEIDGTRQMAYAMANAEVISVVDGEEVRDDRTGLAIFRPDEEGSWRFYRLLHHSDQ